MLSKRNKTYKREVALFLLIFFCYVVYVGNIGMVEVIVWPIFAFAMAAFGLDGYAKQIRPSDSGTATNTDARSL